jgi:hypothetical protein
MDDLVTALRNTDSRCLFGFGQAKGETRAIDALIQALQSPLLDRGQMAAHAKNVLVHICGGSSLTLFEIETLMRELGKELSDDAQILFGAAIDTRLDEHLSVTILTSLNRPGPAPEEAPPVAKVEAPPQPAVPAAPPAAPAPAAAPKAQEPEILTLSGSTAATATVVAEVPVSAPEPAAAVLDQTPSPVTEMPVPAMAAPVAVETAAIPVPAVSLAEQPQQAPVSPPVAAASVPVPATIAGPAAEVVATPSSQTAIALEAAAVTFPVEAPLPVSPIPLEPLPVAAGFAEELFAKQAAPAADEYASAPEAVDAAAEAWPDEEPVIHPAVEQGAAAAPAPATLVHQVFQQAPAPSEEEWEAENLQEVSAGNSAQAGYEAEAEDEPAYHPAAATDAQSIYPQSHTEAPAADPQGMHDADNEWDSHPMHGLHHHAPAAPEAAVPPPAEEPARVIRIERIPARPPVMPAVANGHDGAAPRRFVLTDLIHRDQQRPDEVPAAGQNGKADPRNQTAPASRAPQPAAPQPVPSRARQFTPDMERVSPIRPIVPGRQAPATAPVLKAAAPPAHHYAAPQAQPQPTQPYKPAYTPQVRAPQPQPAPVLAPVASAVPQAPVRHSHTVPSSQQQTFDERLQPAPASPHFKSTKPTLEGDEDLDVPTFLRRKR